MILTKLARGILTMLSLFVLVAVASAQTRTVSGKVTDSNGDGVPSATVIVKGTKVSTTTGADGSFTLNGVPANASTLVISSVGYVTQEVSITGTNDVSVSLEAQNAALNEVVVIGYGTRKSKDATGSVATITTKDFNKGQISTPEQLLQGRTPGVSITPSSGEPGAAATINIRGTASIRGNQDPLYVVDGIPINIGGTSASASGAEGATTAKNPLMFLNPADIESISILKDASAAAIYGTRGANGVIIITTKSGRGSKGTFDFSASTSFSSPASRYDLMDGPTFLAALSKTKGDLGFDPSTADVNKGANTDWQDVIFRNTISQNYNLGWGFNRNGTTLRLSGSYDDQQGIIENTSLKRFTTRANISQKFWDNRIKLDGIFSYSNIRNTYAPITNNAGFLGSLVGAAITANPTYPIKNPNGSFFEDGSNRNPATMLAYFTDGDRLNRFLMNLGATIQIAPGLSYKATFGYDNSRSERTAFADPRLPGTYVAGNYGLREFGDQIPNSGIGGNGRATRQSFVGTSALIEHTLTLDKSFTGGHRINILAGYGYQDFRERSRTMVAYGLANPVTQPGDEFVKSFSGWLNYFYDIPNNTRTELQSYFGRAEYSLKDKYYLTATFRADGSPKFGANNKYGYFPAFAAKWRLANEEFLNSSIGKWFSDFSLRANYGVLGNQDGLPANASTDLIIRNPYNPGATRLLWTGNANLKWEEATTIGAGLDFAVTGNRFSGTIDYFFTKRRDLISLVPTPGGFAPSAFYFVNLPGYVENKGVEVILNFTPVKSAKFSWDISVNGTYVTNIVRDYTNPPLPTGAVSGPGLTGAFAQTLQNNLPLFTWRMPVFEGLDDKGLAAYANGSADQNLGSALPKFFGGITNTISIGNFTGSIFLNTVRGFYVYNNTANAFSTKGILLTGRNVTNETGASNESGINPGSVSTRFLEKGDFVRISNVNLSYVFDLKTKAIRTLSVFASGQNLALFTKYSGLDPEVNVDKNISGIPSRGFDYTGYPRPRVITLGVNVGF